jgi:aspartate 1-decarboxylase
MHVRLLRSKLHLVTVTSAALDYHGSITIDQKLLDAARLLPYEVVTLGNLSNGDRAETYVIPAPAGSGIVQVNGAIARLAQPGDRLIVMSFAYLEPSECKDHKPRIVVCGERNSIAEQWDG